MMRAHVVAATILLAATVCGAEPAPRSAKTVLDDGAYLATSPFRINRDNAPWVAGAGGLIVGAALLDKTIEDHLFPWSGSKSSKEWRSFGNAGQLFGPIAGTVFAIDGWGHGNEKSKDTAFLSFESFAWAGAIEGVLKFVVGRERPVHNDNPFEFKFGRKNASFPSGHTTTAFAGATVLAEQYPEWYVVIPSYGIAAGVGFSRMYADQHWFSDVIGGALLGTAVSHFLRQRHRHPEQYTWSLETDGSSLKLVRKF